jgi:hypothetical protein
VPSWKAFTAFLYLVTASRYRLENYFHDAKLDSLASVWDLMLLKRVPAVHQKMLEVEIQHKECLTQWLQSAFLIVGFPPELRLRIFDRFVRFATPAFFSFGIVVLLFLGNGEKPVVARDGDALRIACVQHS